MVIGDIGIIGLGLIGGSLAKALKRSCSDLYIKALDRDSTSLSNALSNGIIDKKCKDLEDVVKGSKLIFLCTPVDSIAPIMSKIGPHLTPNTIVTDVCSIKGSIMESAKGILPKDVYFIGGHPMAGAENSGYLYSTAHLFENAFYVLTPFDDTPLKAVQIMVELVSSVGAFPLIMNADIHDEIVAAVSHLPHVVSAALVNTVSQIDDPSRFKEKLAAGGFKDITRIASSSPEMWANISILNREKLSILILSMIDNLQKFYNLLNRKEENKIEEFFKDAKKYRDELPTIQSSTSVPYRELYVDIEDKPGTIGAVTSLLGEHGINIKNVRIIHSREHEPGCLIMSLSNSEDVDRALSLLVQKGYRSYRR